MILRGATCALIIPYSAIAEPCIGDDFDRMFPGATEVQTYYVDVPTSQFPGIWQEGSINNFFYRIYGNGDALLRATGHEWEIFISCDLSEMKCNIDADGNPPIDAESIAEGLALCFTAPEQMTFDRFGTQPSRIDAVQSQSPLEELDPMAGVSSNYLTQGGSLKSVKELSVDSVEHAKCGLGIEASGSRGLILQRLIVLAGGDPGPLDGIVGGKTKASLINILGEEADGLDVNDAIDALESYLCAD